MTDRAVDSGTVELANEAGNILLSMRNDAASTLETKAHENDFVSAADRASETLIIEGILAVRPNDGIFGEEGGERPGVNQYRWVIDPLDGTRNYIDGFGPWAVSIALEYQEQSILGVIRDAVNDETYVATFGGGATCNGNAIHARTGRTLAQSVIGLSFLPDQKGKSFQTEVIGQLIPKIGDYRRHGSAVMQLAKVASGALDGTVSLSVGRWDMAAGALIAAEAGAWVGDVDGGPPTPECTIAVGTNAADDLRHCIRMANERRQ